MIVIAFSHQEDTGIRVVKASLERLKPFFEQFQIGKVHNEKVRAEKIFARCKKLSQNGNRIDAIVFVRSSLASAEQIRLSFVPRELSDNLKKFIEGLKASRAQSKPELIELNKAEFPIQLKTLGNFSPLALLLEFSFNRSNPFDYDLRKFRKKKSSESLLKMIKNLKKFLGDLEDHCKKKAAAVSRARSREVSELSGSLEGLEKQLITSRKALEAEQDKAKKEQALADWRKSGEDGLFELVKSVVWPKLTEKSPYALSLEETTDAAGRNLSIKATGRTLADIFLSGTGDFEILKRSPMEKMSLITFYEKLSKGELPEKWKDKFGVKK